MLTNEIVLKVFSDYLNRDTDFEVVLTSRGYTVMGFDNHRQEHRGLLPYARSAAGFFVKRL